MSLVIKSHKILIFSVFFLILLYLCLVQYCLFASLQQTFLSENFYLSFSSTHPLLTSRSLSWISLNSLSGSDLCSSPSFPFRISSYFLFFSSERSPTSWKKDLQQSRLRILAVNHKINNLENRKPVSIIIIWLNFLPLFKYFLLCSPCPSKQFRASSSKIQLKLFYVKVI